MGKLEDSGTPVRKTADVPFPLSSPTIGALVRAIDDGYTAAEIGTLILEADAAEWEPESSKNKQDRLQRLFQAIQADGGPKTTSAALEILVMVLRHGDGSGGWDRQPARWFARVRTAAAADGFEYNPDTQLLLSTMPSGKMLDYVSIVDRELKARGWTVAAGHYKQAIDAFGVGNWASANAQLRSTLEEVLPAVTEQATGTRPTEVQAALEKLQKKGLLDGGEFSLAKGLWSMCQSNGSHPGLSDEDEARFRLVSVTAYLRYLLEREIA